MAPTAPLRRVTPLQQTDSPSGKAFMNKAGQWIQRFGRNISVLNILNYVKIT
ncbi:MAG: hypothetical protein QME51_06385 [Planctomycetota bacterium]|nr:hypothetical protein [Planctomycetota bacterium]